MTQLPKILLVDDQANFIKMIKIKLDRIGYQIITAENGKEAVEKAIYEKPALIIMDIMMPVMDGFSAARKLKESQNTSQIPIIFLTAKSQASDREEARALGAIDYITKPFSPKVLLEKIEKLFDNSSKKLP